MKCERERRVTDQKDNNCGSKRTVFLLIPKMQDAYLRTLAFPPSWLLGICVLAIAPGASSFFTALFARRTIKQSSTQ